ncbi:MAG: hypothetical protein M1269_11225 [Chloroflexi bacterium]|nr:hypothetical protein [Chloroflexota bacterium]
MTDPEKIRLFVRQTLGCTCPDEVFEIIKVSRDVKIDNEIVISERINIGNRLLIYVVDFDAPGFITDKLPAVVYAGKKERNDAGFNRLRVVIVTDCLDEISRVAKETFDAIDFRDEKIHLHVVDKSEMENI